MVMGIVNQEPTLFNDTYYNNMALGVEGVTQSDIEAAANVANAHEFVSTSPDGYQTVVGDRGNKMSGGQRQRISIARAVLANPPILILDEATSALDTESEKIVQAALDNLMQNRTSIVIAHRLSTIKNADDFAMFLLNVAHVAAVPGSAFGTPNYIRFSYATADEKLKQAAERIAKAVEQLK